MCEGRHIFGTAVSACISLRPYHHLAVICYYAARPNRGIKERILSAIEQESR